MSELDDEYKRQAEEAERAEKERQANRGSNFAFENVKYTGLEKRIKLYRFFGPPGDFNLGGLVKNVGKHDARVARIASLLDDKGKLTRLVLPMYGRGDQDHPLVKLIQEVNKGKWVPDPSGKKDPKTGDVKNIKLFENESLHPEIFAMVNRSGIDPSDNRVKIGLMGKGWSGKEFLLANVIDRENMAWHRENKHLMVLSKDVRQGTKSGPDGKFPIFAEPGVPAYGFVLMLNSSFVKYWGSYENYDIGIERTGITSPAYNMFNFDHPAILNDPKLLAIVGAKGPMTEEELTWEPYDLDKIGGLSSYSKIWTRLQRSIAQIDATLGTHFLDEIKALAEAEKALRKANAEVEKEAQEADERDEILEAKHNDVEDAPFDPEEHNSKIEGDDEVIIRSAPQVQAAPIQPAEVLEPRDRELLPGWGALKPDEKDKVLSAYKENDAWVVKYSVRARGKCGKCGARSPETFETCPECGSSFGTF